MATVVNKADRKGPLDTHIASPNDADLNSISSSLTSLVTIEQDNQNLDAGTDRSGSITLGGTAQQLAAANTSRRELTGQNISTGDLWINEIGGTAAADTAGSFRVPAGQGFEIETTRAVSIVGAVTGQKFSATEK